MQKILAVIMPVVLAYIFLRVGILFSFSARFFLDREYIRLTEAGQDTTLVNLALFPFTNVWMMYAIWGGLGLISGLLIYKKFLK